MQDKLRVMVPLADYPVVRVTVEHPDGTTQIGEFIGGTCKEHEFTLPEGVEPDQCGVFAELCRQSGQVDLVTRPIVIQEPMVPESGATDAIV